MTEWPFPLEQNEVTWMRRPTAWWVREIAAALALTALILTFLAWVVG